MRVLLHLSRRDYLTAYDRSPAIFDMAYPNGCWGQPMLIDWPLCQCVLVQFLPEMRRGVRPAFRAKLKEHSDAQG